MRSMHPWRSPLPGGRCRRASWRSGLSWQLAVPALLLTAALLWPPCPAAAAGAASEAAAAAVWNERPPAAAPAPPVLPPVEGPLSPAHKYFSDVELIDQNGQPHRFYSDLLEGKTVVVAAFFTSCTGSCPVLGQKLEALQGWLGDRLGKEVNLLSVTVDPLHDTPAKLKEYAGHFGARPGWYFLTGKKENVDWALYRVGHYVEQKEDHSNLLIMGNETTGLWKKVFGLAPTADVIHSLEGVLHDRG